MQFLFRIRINFCNYIINTLNSDSTISSIFFNSSMTFGKKVKSQLIKTNVDDVNAITIV